MGEFIACGLPQEWHYFLIVTWRETDGTIQGLGRTELEGGMRDEAGWLGEIFILRCGIKLRYGVDI